MVFDHPKICHDRAIDHVESSGDVGFQFQSDVKSLEPHFGSVTSGHVWRTEPIF
jgi:hypothetical protein